MFKIQCFNPENSVPKMLSKTFLQDWVQTNFMSHTKTCKLLVGQSLKTSYFRVAKPRKTQMDMYATITRLKSPLTQTRGVFDQQFDPLVFESFLKFATKRAKITMKEQTQPQNKARFGLGRVNYPYEDYLFVKICKL